ncbi:hypothetical protein CAPTEDRAFT_215579, partial [Capitella teleta]
SAPVNHETFQYLPFHGNFGEGVLKRDWTRSGFNVWLKIDLLLCYCLLVVGGKPRLTSLKDYPASHTAVDNLRYLMTYIDPSLRAHATLARLMAEMTLRLSAQAKLPMDAREIGATLEEEFNGLHATLSAPGLPHLPNLGQLLYRVSNLTAASLTFHASFSQLDASNLLLMSFSSPNCGLDFEAQSPLSRYDRAL